MNAYLVRFEGTKEYVGIFVCERQSLDLMIDECTDPGLCEYAVLGAGGIYSEKPGAPAVPNLEDEEKPDWFADATTSELWWRAFATEDARWLPLYKHAKLEGAN